MNTLALGLSAAGFVVVMGTLVSYFATIPRGTVPVKIGGLVVRLSVGVALAALAILSSSQGAGSAGALVIAPAAFAMVMGSAVLWLLTQRKTPIGDLKVAVGDKLLPFETTASDGAKFRSDDLVGKRTLLKFFRGGW